LIQFNGKQFDWKVFYLKRVFRLFPLHLVVTFLIITIVFIETDFEINVSRFRLLKSFMKWFGFGILGFEELNEYPSSIINAGVLWSLSYEWLFYLSLPLAAVLAKKTRPHWILILILVGLITLMFCARSFRLDHVISFAGGAVSPFFIRYNLVKTKINHPVITIITLACIIGLFQFNTSANYVCKLLIVTSFTTIALGNNIFGLLKNPTLKFLGDMSYSTYLVHGVLLFILFNYILGLGMTKSLSPAQYSLVIVLFTPLVILISYILFMFLEKPGMSLGRHLSEVYKKVKL
jgi:peptidoglycan/LPS O-acetylase OafA/YrhL